MISWSGFNIYCMNNDMVLCNTKKEDIQNHILAIVI